MDLTFSSDNLYKAVGEAIIFGSIQFSIGSVEMSSKFSIMNFAKDQSTLDNAMAALKDYMKIGLLWTIGTSLIMYSNFQQLGLLTNLIVNIGIMVWIGYSYHICFKKAVEKYSLLMPSYF